MPVVDSAQERMQSWHEAAVLDPRFRRLTLREREVGAMTIYGMTRKEIAEELDVSVRTIDTHKGHVLRKLECHHDIELVWRAFEIGWVK
jgi:two-component system response regulator NreC